MSDLAAAAEQALLACRQKGVALAVAESCTSGLVMAALGAVPGASDVLLGGVVAYANPVKTSLLEVPAGTLDAHGAVSRETARAMASGARRRFAAGLAVSVTGIAGPGGGSAEKPPGTVWLGWSTPEDEDAVLWRFSGGRQAVREAAALEALGIIRRAALQMPA